MTTFRVDGYDTAPLNSMADHNVYSLPLNTTSAINIQLFGQQTSYSEYDPNLTPSASTYVSAKRSSTQQYAPDKYSVIINTDDNASQPNVYPINVAKYPAPSVYATLPPQTYGAQTQDSQMFSQQQPQHVHLQQRPYPQVSSNNIHYAEIHDRHNDREYPDEHSGSLASPDRTSSPISSISSYHDDKYGINGTHRDSTHGQRPLLLSFESEPDSARGSIPDDTASVNSYGSHGTTESLHEAVTSLNLNTSNDDTHQEQQDFIYGRTQSLTESIDSQLSNYSSMASPTSGGNKKDKRVKFQNMLPLTWDDDEGSDNSLDSSLNARMVDASAFILDEFTEDETRTMENAETLKGTRIALYRGEFLTAMIKAKCSSDEMGFDLRVLTLLKDILVRCDQLGQKMQGSAVRLTPFHLNKLRLLDGRLSRERADEVAHMLGGDIILCEAVCQKHAERIHIATDIRDSVYEKGNFFVGRSGILVTLWKKHKYSVAAEFSAPLCDHITFYRPSLLGSTSESALKRKRKGTDTVRKVFQSRELLSQMFKADPTITVAEAARRSFVEVVFYAQYE